MLHAIIQTDAYSCRRNYDADFLDNTAAKDKRQYMLSNGAAKSELVHETHSQIPKI